MPAKPDYKGLMVQEIMGVEHDMERRVTSGRLQPRECSP